MTNLTPIWGYTPDGRARVFDDGVLPIGWSPDTATLPEECRNGDYVSRADYIERSHDRSVDVDDALNDATQPVKRGPGRPRKIVDFDGHTG